MEKGKEEYEICLLWTVVAVDRSNSTHLEAVNDVLKGMRSKILRRCPDLMTHMKELEKEIQSSFGDPLLYDMCREQPVKRKRYCKM